MQTASPSGARGKNLNVQPLHDKSADDCCGCLAHSVADFLYTSTSYFTHVPEETNSLFIACLTHESDALTDWA